jgi:hypothetical protein
MDDDCGDIYDNDGDVIVEFDHDTAVDDDAAGITYTHKVLRCGWRRWFG